MTTLYNAKHWKVPVPPLPNDIHDKVNEFMKNAEDEVDDGSADDSKTGKKMKKKKIVIVGAGVAGLFAAYTLEYLGVADYEILEASSRTGGRFYSTGKLTKNGDNSNDGDDDDGFELDLGAEWCHVNPQILQDLLLFDDQLVDSDGITKTTTSISDDHAHDNSRLFSYHPQTYTFQTKEGKPVRRDLMRYIYKEYKFKSTTWGDYLQDYVLSKINPNKIRFNTPVKHIDYSGGGPINVTAVDGTVWKADKVIVAVSLGIMKSDDDVLSFTPAMPLAQRDAIQKAEMGQGLKIMIQFEQRFYTDITIPNPLVELSDHDLVGFYDAVYNKDTTKHILGVAAVGTEGRSTRLAAMNSESDIVKEVLNMLDTLYDGQASQYYICHDMINWSRMPYVRGAYSHITDPELSKTIGLPLAEAVYFAGEHVSEYHIGYMHGSAITGRRAAVMAVGGEAMKIEPCRLSLQNCINN